MKKVWIAQLKCPSSHCVIALAAEITENDTGALEAKLWSCFQNLVDNNKLNYECGLCKSKTLHAEVKRTPFDTLEFAMPALEEGQRQQLATAAFLRSTKN